MAVDLVVFGFFGLWTLLLVDAIARVDSRVRAATEFRAAALLLETRRNG